MAASRRRPYRSRTGWIPRAAGAAASLTAAGFKKWSGSSGTKTSARQSAPGPITGETDWRTTYRRKPFPRRRKKRWIKFSKRVKAVIGKGQASKFAVLTSYLSSSANVNLQNYNANHTVLGSNGSTNVCDDLSVLFTEALKYAQESNPAVTRASLKLLVTGWMCETQIKNNSDTSTCYVDMYYWKCKRDVGQSVSCDDVGQLWTTGFTDIRFMGGVGQTSLSTGDYGVTPFQCPLFTKHVKVYKKTRVKLGPGGTCQIETRSGKNYMRSWSIDQRKTMLANVTEGVFFIHYGIPAAPSTLCTASEIICSTNKNITWKVVASNEFLGMHET